MNSIRRLFGMLLSFEKTGQLEVDHAVDRADFWPHNPLVAGSNPAPPTAILHYVRYLFGRRDLVLPCHENDRGKLDVG